MAAGRVVVAVVLGDERARDGEVQGPLFQVRSLLARVHGAAPVVAESLRAR